MLSNIPEAFIKLATDAIGITDHKDSPKAIERMSECFKCEKGGNNNPEEWNKFCGVCGCYMPGKVLVDKETCPENKWQ